jgi:cell division protein FtsQ
VVGVDILTPQEVRVAAAVPDGLPLARVDLPGVRSRVEALAPVDRVLVSRDWPDTVVVQVVERSAAAAVPQGRGFALIDDDGVAFQTVAARPAHLPLARVARPGPDDGNTRSALKVLAALTDDLRERLVAVQVEGPARITVELRGPRQVIWGDATDNETKARVATALLAQKGNTIDVSAPEVVTIR